METLLIIDMQRDFVEPGGKLYVAGAKDTIQNCVDLAKYFRDSNKPIIHVIREHNPDGSDCELMRKHLFTDGNGYCVKGTIGAEIVSQLFPEPQDFIIVKKRFSAFFDTPLENLLKQLKTTKLFIAGTQYPNCIRATAVDALMRDFSVIICTDCCSAQTYDIAAAANINDLRAMNIPCLDNKEIMSRKF